MWTALHRRRREFPAPPRPEPFEPAETRPDRRITLAPAQKNLRLHGPGEALKRTFNRRPFVAGDVISTSVHAPRSFDGVPEGLRAILNLPAYGLQEIRLLVIATEPRGIVHMTPETEVVLRQTFEEPSETRRPDITYDDIGGLGDTVEQIREMVELPLRHPELFQRLGIDASFLINGPEILGRRRESRRSACARSSTRHVSSPRDHLHRRDRQSRACPGRRRRHHGLAPPRGPAAPAHRLPPTLTGLNRRDTDSRAAVQGWFETADVRHGSDFCWAK